MSTPVVSPCVAICQIDRATSVCSGCKRTLQEIANWLQYSPTERALIMELLPLRISTPRGANE